ncbi:MAG: DNA gyrase subunit A [Streptococcus agalactiae]
MSNIQNMSLEDIMGERFGRYSKYIIQERALPDIRDGLKPVQRRILYSMNKDGNTFEKGFRKSAKSVGNVMGISILKGIPLSMTRWSYVSRLKS